MNSFLIKFINLAFIILFVMFFLYIRDLEKHDCVCSENWKRDYIQYFMGKSLGQRKMQMFQRLGKKCHEDICLYNVSVSIYNKWNDLFKNSKTKTFNKKTIARHAQNNK